MRLGRTRARCCSACGYASRRSSALSKDGHSTDDAAFKMFKTY